jgi:hypothetical protein
MDGGMDGENQIRRWLCFYSSSTVDLLPKEESKNSLLGGSLALLQGGSCKLRHALLAVKEYR